MDDPQDSQSLEGHVAMITGAGSGIGRAMSTLFASRGAAVAVLDIDLGRADATVASIVAAGGRALAVRCDVADSSSVKNAVEVALDHLGSISILCCNAGILDDFKPVLETDEELWDAVLGVNLKGVYLTTRAVLPQMLAAGHGVIINTASISGMIAGGGGAAYTASKHGVIGLTRQLSFDYASQGIRANAICPGPVRTAMTAGVIASRDPLVMAAVESSPAGRFAQPEEIAKLALFLAGDDAGFMHGSAVVIDGGWTIH